MMMLEQLKYLLNARIVLLIRKRRYKNELNPFSRRGFGVNRKER